MEMLSREGCCWTSSTFAPKPALPMQSFRVRTLRFVWTRATWARFTGQAKKLIQNNRLCTIDGIHVVWLLFQRERSQYMEPLVFVAINIMPLDAACVGLDATRLFDCH